LKRKGSSLNTQNKNFNTKMMSKKRGTIFYGWWIVGACFLISMYLMGVIHFGFTAVFQPIASEFGWSFALISLAASIRGMETGFLAPVVGLLIDRWGPKKLLIIGIIISGLSMVLLSRINSLATFYGTYILTAAGISACSTIVPMTVAANWFRRKVSVATGIVVAGTAAGGLLVPLVTRLVDALGWRMAMMYLGIGAWVVFLPLTLLVRHKPEQYGLLPDGDSPADIVSKESKMPVPITETQISVKQVLKTRTFWHIAIGMTCHLFVISSLLTHVIPYLTTLGIPRSTSSLMASVIALGNVIGRLSFGWLGDRFDKRRISASGFALLGLGVFLFGYGAAGTWLLIPAIILIGIGYGGPVPMIPALIREYFGNNRMGSILGFVMGVMTLGSIAGPPLAGWVYDIWGNYQGAWLAFAAVVIIGMFSILTTPPAGSKKIA
jgi:sugar phosphate permease